MWFSACLASSMSSSPLSCAPIRASASPFMSVSIGVRCAGRLECHLRVRTGDRCNSYQAVGPPSKYLTSGGIPCTVGQVHTRAGAEGEEDVGSAPPTGPAVGNGAGSDA